MATTTDDGDPTVASGWHRRGRTTIELCQRGPDEWLATQRGVDVEGRGESAAAAAMAYCQAIDGDRDPVAESTDPGSEDVAYRFYPTGPTDT